MSFSPASSGCRVVLPTSAVQAILENRPILISDLSRRVRASLIAYAIENKIMDSAGKISAAAIIGALPAAPTQEQWAAMSMAQRETYPDSIFFEMESSLI